MTVLCELCGPRGDMNPRNPVTSTEDGQHRLGETEVQRRDEGHRDRAEHEHDDHISDQLAPARIDDLPKLGDNLAVEPQWRRATPARGPARPAGPRCRVTCVGRHSLHLPGRRIPQGRQDSNLQPPVLETGALPIEPRPFALRSSSEQQPPNKIESIKRSILMTIPDDHQQHYIPGRQPKRVHHTPTQARLPGRPAPAPAGIRGCPPGSDPVTRIRRPASLRNRCRTGTKPAPSRVRNRGPDGGWVPKVFLQTRRIPTETAAGPPAHRPLWRPVESERLRQ